MNILQAPPVPRPPQHSGGPESDVFRVTLTSGEAHEVCSHLLSSEAAAVSRDGQTTPLASKIASLVDRWSRYAEALDDAAKPGVAGGRSPRSLRSLGCSPLNASIVRQLEEKKW